MSKDVPANAVVGGAPVRVLRMRGRRRRRRPSCRYDWTADGPGRACPRPRTASPRCASCVGLGRGGGVAGAAVARQVRAAELVLAAVLAGGGDRGRVAAGLALGDARRARRTHRRGRRRAGRPRAGAGEAERLQRLRADDAVDGQPVAALEALDRALGLRAHHAVGGDAELGLHVRRSGWRARRSRPSPSRTSARPSSGRRSFGAPVDEQPRSGAVGIGAGIPATGQH